MEGIERQLRAGGKYRLAATADYLLRLIVTGPEGQEVRLDLEPEEAADLEREIHSGRQDVGVGEEA